MENTATLQAAEPESVKPGTRFRVLSARFSESDYAALERKARQSGKTVPHWAREILLCDWPCGSPAEIQNHVFTELIAIELVLMNALEPLLHGEKLSREQTAQIFREVQATKEMRAQQILMKRVRAKEK